MEEEIENVKIMSTTSIPEFGDEEKLEGASIEEPKEVIADE